MANHNQILKELEHRAVLRRHRLRCFGDDEFCGRIAAMISDRLARIAA